MDEKNPQNAVEIRLTKADIIDIVKAQNEPGMRLIGILEALLPMVVEKGFELAGRKLEVAEKQAAAAEAMAAAVKPGKKVGHFTVPQP